MFHLILVTFILSYLTSYHIFYLILFIDLRLPNAYTQ